MSYGHPELMCRVERIEYDFEQHRALICLPPNNYPDMGGTIAAVRRIDEKVQEIATLAGDLPDTVYILSDGQWRAVRPPASAWRLAPGFRPRPVPLWGRSC